MKAITLWNPWAYLVWLAGHQNPEIAKLGKRIETRSWYTSYRGPLAIHAAKAIPDFAEELCETEPYFSTALYIAGINFTGDIPLKTLIPCGAVLCTCRLVDCLKVRTTRIVKRDGIPVRVAFLEAKNRLIEVTGNELAFGDYTPGRYAWILEDIKPLPEPIPAVGRQGLWNWELPEAGAEWLNTSTPAKLTAGATNARWLLMVERKCPKCGAVWYSADQEGSWTCKECGAEIGVDD